MAAEPKVDALLGRALRDKAFRDRLVANPAEIAKEAGLSAEQLELVAGGLALGTSIRDPGQVMYCTEKTCNERGGARVIIFSPDPAFNPLIGNLGPNVLKKTPGGSE
jgi:hypothetical protein